MIGQIINAGSQLAQSVINARTAKRNTDMTIAANKNMAEYAYSKDLEMWNRQNEYNSPEAQQERLSRAGLNPNLVYGSGSVVGNTSGALPKYNAPTAKYEYEPGVNLPAMISAFQDFKIKKATSDKIEADVANKNQDTANKAATAAWIGIKTAMDKEKYNLFVETYPFQKGSIENQARILEEKKHQAVKGTSIMGYQQSMKEQEAKAYQRLLNLQLNNAAAALKRTTAETSRAQADTALKLLDLKFGESRNVIDQGVKILNAIFGSGRR